MCEKKENLELQPVNMYILFAKLFAHIAKEVENSCGEEGIKAVREGVKKFGEERGRNIAKRAKLMGHEAVPEYYLSCYDMGRSTYFSSEDKIENGHVEQVFTKCIFAEQWMQDGNEKYGIHYCEMIDPSIAHGFCENFKCMHDKQFFKDGYCHFLFSMQEK